ncbi:MAG TPA: 1-acyl-sn-glycerol-3-phosphate acyltransferase [Pyrinomonadaceae bacterium]|nr:1-acyl-sn-glycerol-3-phosphate acyltransferase [Pyrinomonadaceae bacterium]
MQQEQIIDIQDKVRVEIDSRSALLPSYERVNSFQLSRTVLPRTSTGKLKRHEIGELATRPPTKVAKAWSDEQLRWAVQPDVEKALELIRKQTACAEVHPADRLDLDLEQDSLGRVELIIQLAEAFDTVVPDEVTPSIHTVRDLIDAVLKETNLREKGVAKAPKMIDQPWQQLLSPVATSGLAKKYLAAPSTLSSLLLFTASRFVFLIAKVLLRMKVEGRQNLAEGPLLICPNHQTYFDGLLIASVVPWRVFRRMYFVGAPMYFSRGWLRWLARRAKIVLLDTESNVIESMRVCASGLRQGKAFLIFPEGERTIDGALGNLRKGTAILSTHTEAPIIPVAIRGAFEIWPREKGPQRVNQVRIRFGSSLPPLTLPENITAIEADRVYQTQTDLLAKRIESLIR